MAKSLVESLFSVSQMTKGISGHLGKFYGEAGGQFGHLGKDYGDLGANNAPKYDHKQVFRLESYFQLTNHFDLKSYYDPDKIASDALEFAVSRALGGKR